ncbi:hypothetical protein JQC92_14020 [Shewanella sp. 202IG2-18]|uniref:hypothetical protein n=1 Tax=Parashewanella hymeniacidonis TaxID=2807618 RepID=UPI001960E3B7|nr:hypothetical protein [Parashewanella hymeniacidonis]MBM7073131.1 hypothetical protein [Parashewanella hymeniacidonis]
MTKYLLCILFLLACFQVKAEPSLINVLSSQCENLPSIQLPEAASLSEQQHRYEQQSLVLNNISDGLNYLRQYPLNTSTTEKLINCQMELVQIWDNFIRSDYSSSFIGALTKSSLPKHKLLGLKLQDSKQLLLSENNLARLRTMEAIFRSNLKARTARISVGNINCALNGHMQFGFEEEYSISSYLIKQPNQECRKLVWDKFYHRPYLKRALNEIKKIRTLQAKNNGYADYTHLTIANNYLDTPELIEQYLNLKSALKASLPWNIGSELAKAHKPPKTKTKVIAKTLILEALQDLTKFSIRYDFIENQVIRLWYKEHLLGDIILITNAQTQTPSDMIRYPIVSYQFAQAQLFTAEVLTTQKQQKYLLQQLAKLVTDFAKASHSYLTTNAIEDGDSNNIGEQWLAQYFIRSRLKQHEQNYRQILVKNYLTQLNILRAKIALRFYMKQGISKHELLSQTTSALKAQLPINSDYLFNFDGMIDSGPNFYAKEWQKDLAGYLFNYSIEHDLQHHFFERFIVNEQQKSFQENLNLLLNQNITKKTLIKLVTKFNS